MIFSLSIGINCLTGISADIPNVSSPPKMIRLRLRGHSRTDIRFKVCSMDLDKLAFG